MDRPGGIKLSTLLLLIAILALNIPLRAVYDELKLSNDYMSLIIRRLNDINEKIPPSQDQLISPRHEQEIETFNTDKVQA